MLSEQKSYRACAPGSLMLLGEYAVLYNKPAVVCAVNKRMTVTVTPRLDTEIHLSSPRLGQLKTDLSEVTIAAPFQFVTACIVQLRKKIKTGFALHIEADFSDQIGLGSSAAVTVASLAALGAWLAPTKAKALTNEQALQLIRDARAVIRQVQGVGSGADAAASVLGGVLAYRATPLAVESFAAELPLTVIYSGSKTPTAQAITKVRQAFASQPALFNSLCRGINQCAKEGIRALHEANWQRLGTAMNVQQGLMQALSVSTPLLDKLIAHLRADPATLGAKISGSGFGDCVLGLGESTVTQIESEGEGVKQILVKVAKRGVVIHE